MTRRGTPATRGRHGVHQHRTRIGREPAGDVEAGRLNGGPAVAEFDADRIGVASVGRLLALMVVGDTVAREFQRGQRLGAAQRDGDVDLG